MFTDFFPFFPLFPSFFFSLFLFFLRRERERGTVELNKIASSDSRVRRWTRGNHSEFSALCPTALTLPFCLLRDNRTRVRKGTDAISSGDFIDISFVTANQHKRKKRKTERCTYIYIYILEFGVRLLADPIGRNRSFKDFPVAPLETRIPWTLERGSFPYIRTSKSGGPASAIDNCTRKHEARQVVAVDPIAKRD